MSCKMSGQQGQNRAPALGKGHKSKSCDEEGQDLLVEAKRRSIYAKDCR